MSDYTDYPGARKNLGLIGAPSTGELTSRDWDVIILGGGHNGLTAAAYLARAGKKTLVLEKQERIGGACTIEEVRPGYKISPCAYLCGLLHPRVIADLKMEQYGFAWTPAREGLFVPFPEGGPGDYVQLWEDDERCEAEIKRVAPDDLPGFRKMSAVMSRLRNKLRPEGERDLWLQPAPEREYLEDLLRDDPEARALLFEWSMYEYVSQYIKDERLQSAYLGQGVIGSAASPFDPGTASINFHHSSGRMGGLGGLWGYVRGGMGMVSFILADIAVDQGAWLACGLPVARVRPEMGVELEGGEMIRARAVVSNAAPGTLISLLDNEVDQAWKKKIENIPCKGYTMKLNVALKELPDFRANPGALMPHHRAQINTPLTGAEWKTAHERALAGELPDKLWTELYFQTVHDPSPVPPGKHLMSVFAQYVPHKFARGDWQSRLDEAAELAISSIARYCDNIPDAIEFYEALGPPQIEERVGLPGGHIFQGEILPEYMWEKRLAYRTPMEGVFLCGAATHPGGSVIGVNGRNAAREVLDYLDSSEADL